MSNFKCWEVLDMRNNDVGLSSIFSRPERLNAPLSRLFISRSLWSSQVNAHSSSASLWYMAFPRDWGGGNRHRMEEGLDWNAAEHEIPGAKGGSVCHTPLLAQPWASLGGCIHCPWPSPQSWHHGSLKHRGHIERRGPDNNHQSRGEEGGGTNWPRHCGQ